MMVQRKGSLADTVNGWGTKPGEKKSSRVVADTHRGDEALRGMDLREGQSPRTLRAGFQSNLINKRQPKKETKNPTPPMP